MRINGTTFPRNTLVGESIHGRLVGPGLPSVPPVTGAIGTFRFDHSSGASATGVFATDL
jgi:hypothetical protein